MSQGTFIAFEGGDGAGKSTQISMLAQRLTEHGHQVLLTREPGGTDLGRSLREVLLHTAGPICDRAEVLLFAADRAQHVDQVIRPALGRGDVVLSDRYSDSSVAYQAGGRGGDEEQVRAFSAWASRDLLPDLTVLLDLDPEAARKRREGDVARPGADRMEAEELDFHLRVRQAFLRLAAMAPERYLVLDATEPPQVLAGQVAERVDQIIAAAPDGLGGPRDLPDETTERR